MTPMSFSKNYVVLLFFTAIFFQLSIFCHFSHATLGEKSESIEADRKIVSGNRLQVVTRNLYSIHEVQGQGYSFKEYLSQGGVVFGMTWTRKLPLSLNSIFGSYLADYQQAADKASNQKKIAKFRVRVPHILIRGSQVIFERSGQGLATHFRAIVPQLFPTGVTTNEIQ